MSQLSLVLKQHLVAWYTHRNEFRDHFSTVWWKWKQLPSDNRFFFICSWEKCTSVFRRYLSTRKANLSFANLYGLMCIRRERGVKWSLTTYLDNVKNKSASGHYFPKETVFSRAVLLTEGMYVQQLHSAAQPHSSISFSPNDGFYLAQPDTFYAHHALYIFSRGLLLVLAL